MVEIFKMNFKNRENISNIITAMENHHWLAIKLWLNPYAITDKERRITNNIKYLKGAAAAASLNCAAFILIAYELNYFVDNLKSVIKHYTYYNRIKKSIKINQLNLIK